MRRTQCCYPGEIDGRGYRFLMTSDEGGNGRLFDPGPAKVPDKSKFRHRKSGLRTRQA